MSNHLEIKHQILGKLNKNTYIPRHVRVKVMKTKDKEKIFKEAREKRNITYRRRKIRIIPEYLSRLCKPKPTDLTSLNTKEKKLLTQHSLLREYVFQNRSELKIKFREFINNVPALKEIKRKFLDIVKPNGVIEQDDKDIF